jgi:hypothetical protein
MYRPGLVAGAVLKTEDLEGGLKFIATCFQTLQHAFRHCNMLSDIFMSLQLLVRWRLRFTSAKFFESKRGKISIPNYG